MTENTKLDLARVKTRRMHLIFGWTMFLVFAVLGLCLEALHGFKIGWYLDVGNETRRLMLRLAHAHGTLFALVNIAFAVSIEHFGAWAEKRVDLASRALRIASVLLPGGFFIGGLHIYDGDPGLGIILAPFGAISFLVALVLTVQGARAQ
jgi:hypothetical protein